MSMNKRYIGKYEMQELLGRGDMAEVWKAVDMQLGRNVAIKFLHADLQNDPNFLAHFEREARVIAALHHPNIVKIYDFHISRSPESPSTICYMVMDYVEGPTLASYISQTSRQGKLPPRDDIVYLFRTIGSALDYAHQRGVIHRDIKPANILLDRRRLKPTANPQDSLGEPILSDFGIVKLLGTARPIDTSMGTPAYISPEQVLGFPSNERSDIYSLAVILYEIFTGLVPFLGENAHSIMMQHVHVSPTPPSNINPHVSPLLSAVILRGLAKNPMERFASATQLASALTDALMLSASMDLPVEKEREHTSHSSSASNPQLVALSEIDASTSPSTPLPASATWITTQSSMPDNQNGPQMPYTSIGSNVSVGNSNHAPLFSTLVSSSARFLSRSPVNRKLTKEWLIILAIVVLVIGTALGTFIYTIGSGHATPTATTTPRLPASIGVIQAPDGETIGISDGTYVFDTTSSATDLKEMAAQKLRQGDISSALPLLSEAHDKNTSDAEALIYHENLRLHIANMKYITLVLGTTLTGGADPISVGREDLQAAYLAQRAYNDTEEQHGEVSVRLLIANLGSLPSYAAAVTDQITRLAQRDQTIVGAMGWSLSAHALASVSLLDKARIPVISQAAGDNLTGISKYFFRITALASRQGEVAAQYATKTLNAKSAVVFVDVGNDYSHSLAQGFKKSFVGSIVATEYYTLNDSVTNPQRLVTGLQDALQHHPDIIYFAGYSNDVSILLQHLRPSDPLVLGGNALYRLSYQGVTASGMSHLRFTAPSYPDEWDIMGISARKPSFFQDYPQTFGNGNPQLSYGFTRADSGTMVSYDAMQTLLQASKLALKKTYPITSADLREGLVALTGANAFQGITGQISFPPDSNDIINRAVTVVCNQDGHFKMEEMIVGQFLLNGPVWADYPTKSVCA